MPNRLAGYLHTLSSYIIYRAESKERPLAEVSSECDRKVLRLSHIHAHCQKEEEKEIYVIDPSELRGLSVSFTAASDGKKPHGEKE